ncbi:hypothetical protein QCA50_020267 [Cerrena zonata]|uniref:Uncharacterized protein n=1 Tax=Cerrena zonata TaxID=2478898 RepID=A0AAW0FC53_9APHY
METEKDQGISPVPSPSPTLIGRAVYFSASGTGSDLDPGVIAFHVSGENSTMVGRVYRSDQDGSCHSDRTCFLVLICLPSLVFRPHHSVGDLSNIALRQKDWYYSECDDVDESRAARCLQRTFLVIVEVYSLKVQNVVF